MTKELFYRLYDDDVLKKEYDQIIKEVNSRFDEVVLLLFPNIKKQGGWFVYGNYDYQSDNDEGEFDPIQYRENIELGGEYQVDRNHPLSDGACWASIPTHYLWSTNEDILKDINKQIEIAKKEEELKKQKDQIKKAKNQKLKEETVQSIKSKLTKEELKYIIFK